jgi:hypothetical protein
MTEQDGRAVSCPNGHANPDGSNYCLVCGAMLQGQPTMGASSGQGRRRKGPVGLLIAAGLMIVGGVVLATVLLGANERGTSHASASHSGPDDTPSPEAGSTELEAAYAMCADEDLAGTLSLGDNGHSLIIDTGSESGSIAGYLCLLAELDTSEAVIASMDSTNSLMGVREADDGSFHYQWSYHPDSGINMVITEAKAE